MTRIRSIADYTINAALTRFRETKVRSFNINGKTYSSVDIKPHFNKKGQTNRVAPDRYIFDEQGNFVSRNVTVRTKNGIRTITTVPDGDGHINTIVQRNNLGQVVYQEDQYKRFTDMEELSRPTTFMGKVTGFFKSMFNKLRGQKAIEETPVEMRISHYSTPDGYSDVRYGINAYSSNGKVNIVGNEDTLKVKATKSDKNKTPVWFERIEDMGTITGDKDVYALLSEPLKKLASLIK